MTITYRIKSSGIRLTLVLVALVCVAAALRDLRSLIDLHHRQADFEVYYTAGAMVRTHMGRQIYNGADTGVDPQLRYAEDHSLFADEASALGIDKVQLYVYPPTLADLLMVLSLFHISTAAAVWKLVNWIALLGVAWMLVVMLGLPMWSTKSLAVVAFLFLFRPDLDCFYWGQITIVLICIEMAGMLCYARGYKVLAAFLFSIPIAIKLTPLIVIIPLLTWRDWKTLRAIALWCLAFLGIMCLTNGTELLVHYVQQVLPSMSHGIVELTNKSLSSSLQVMWRASHHGISSAALGPVTKVLSILILCYAGWLSQSLRNENLESDRLASLSMFLVLSACIAPVSWRHAYVFAVPAIIMLLKEAIDGRLRIVQMILLEGFLLSISSFGFNAIALSTGKAIFYDLAMLTPWLGIALVIVELHRRRSLSLR